MTARPVTVFYAAAAEPGRPLRLLLGPFAERGLAVSALEPARDLDYLVAGGSHHPVPTRVRVVTLRVRDRTGAPAGELNAAAIRLAPAPEPVPHMGQPGRGSLLRRLAAFVRHPI